MAKKIVTVQTPWGPMSSEVEVDENSASAVSDEMKVLGSKVDGLIKEMTTVNKLLLQILLK